MIQQPRNHRLLCFVLALALGTLLPACSGGGSSGGGGGNMGPLIATFSPTTPNPGASTINMAGTSSGAAFSVIVQVTGVNDFFGSAFRVTFDPASAQFMGFSSSGSFLTGVGTFFDAVPNPANAGELFVTATIQDAAMPAGIDVTGTATLITLNFQATATTAGNALAFGTPADREVTACPNPGGACDRTVATTLTWSGGVMTASR